MVKIMKCPKCGKECSESNSIAGNRGICPFCGGKFSQYGNTREEITKIMKNLVGLYGVAVLEDINRTNALLMDYAPHLNKERKLIVMVMREGIVPQLIKMIGEEEDNQRQRLNRWIKQLTESIWITETAAVYAVLTLASAVGITVCLGTEEQVSGIQYRLSGTEIESSKLIKVLTKEMGLLSEDAIYYALKECDSIGYKALAANTNIKQIVLPENVKMIYPKAFLNCVNLCRITLPREIRSIGICAFEGCSSLKKIEISNGSHYRVIDGVLIDKVSKRALRAENDISKETVRIADGVSTICKKAFDRSSVKCIRIPMSVNHIEENAFFLTQSLERFEVDSKNSSYREIDGVLHNRSASILIKYPQGKKDIGYYLEDTVEEIGLQAFSCVQNIQSVTFTGTLKKIGDRAFEYCTNIENIVLSGNIEKIGNRAFQYCEKMRGVMLSRNIQEIGDGTFYHCVSLETISIPKNVKKIGNLAFADCRKLKTITIQDNVSLIGDGVFVGCEGVEIRIRNNPYMEIYCRSRGINFSNI